MGLILNKILKQTRHKAESIINNSSRLSSILKEADKKTKTYSGQIKTVIQDLKTLMAMLKAWVSGEYSQVPWLTLISALTAVLYFLNPLDLISDMVPGLGFIDDAFVIGYVAKQIRKDLQKFSAWKTENDNTIVIS